MPDLLHRIQIGAPPEKVFKALTEADGLSSWWTGDVEAEPKVGSVAIFGFSNRATVFRMKVVEFEPNRRVVWECLGDWPQWVDTRLTWALSEKNGGTELNFTHANWKSTDGVFADCNSTWGALMYRIRDYVEGKKPGPLFKGHV